MIRLHPLITGVFCAFTLLAQHARIVSTSPSITETLFALGLGNRVVGVSNYCRFPPAVLSLPKIGTYVKPDAERIALLRPDLVIIHESATDLREKMDALGIASMEVDSGSLAQIYSMVDEIGRATGSSPRAEKLNRDIRAHLEVLREETRRQPKPAVLLLVGRNPGLLTGLIAVGSGPYLGELLEIAGGRNVLTGAAFEYPHISLETVERLNPDVILDASMMAEAGSDLAPQEARLREPWLAHSELTAVRTGMIFGIASESLVTPGPRVVEVVELIRARIYAKGVR